VDLVGDVPALYWSRSAFNPAALQRKNQKEFDIGTAAHVAVLEPDLYSELVVHVPLDTYHKAEAREMRDAAWIAGQTPLKPSEIEIVDGVRDAIQHRPDVARLFTAEVGHSSAVTNGFVADSLLGQAGFEPSVPHLIGGVRRAIGKAADKLREAPDAGTRVAESSFFEPSESAPSAARDPGRKKLQPPGRLASSIYQNLPRIICRDWPAASPREQRVSPPLRGRYKRD
jgi:hypothetical protein